MAKLQLVSVTLVGSRNLKSEVKAKILEADPKGFVRKFRMKIGGVWVEVEKPFIILVPIK